MSLARGLACSHTGWNGGHMANDVLTEGTVLRGADTGKPIVVVQHLGGGGQGDVYEVDYDGMRKALKWYRNPRLVPESLFTTLANNAHNGSPGAEFMWPIETTERTSVTVEGKDGPHVVTSFGYVMDLIPAGYYSFESFLLTECRFASFRVAVDACLEISKVFRILRSQGLCYQDLNAGNFFFDPNTGNVVICDCDNVAENGISTGIIGTPGFMAPELVIDDYEYVNDAEYRSEYVQTGMRRHAPSYKTDRFSMSVLFFEILTLTNPLAGRRSLCPQDFELKAHLYGYDALFMFDANSDENRPHPEIHKNAISAWNAFPSYLRATFQRAFSQEALRDENARVTEGEWLEALVRFRADIFRCPNCNSPADLFTDSARETRCDACGKMVKPPFVFVFENGVRIPALPDTRIYRIQVGPTHVGRELEPVAAMVANQSAPNDPRRWGVRNYTDQDFVASIRGVRPRAFGPQEVVPMGPDLTIRVYDRSIKVEVNNG